MIPQLATVSGFIVGTKVPFRDPDPGVSQFRPISTCSSLICVDGEAGQGVAGFELGGLELELSLELSAERGLVRAA